MHVVIVATFAPPLLGGRQRDAAMLVNALRSAGHEAILVAQFALQRFPLRQRFTRCESERSFSHGEISVSIVKPFWPMRITGSIIYAMLWLPMLHAMAQAILERAFRRSLRPLVRGADLVHYLGTGTEPIGFAAWDAARACGAAFVIQPAIHPGRWGDRSLDARLYRKADAVLAFTNPEASIVRQLGVPDEQVRIVPGCADSPPENPDPQGFRNQHGIDGPLVLFVGRKIEEKGVNRLRKAWPLVRSEFPAAKLVFVGPGKISPQVEQGDGIIDITDASEQVKHDALAACDIFCLPSLAESFGIAVFEALSHGKPVVVGDIPAFRELVGDKGCGLLVAPQPSEIADAIIKILRQPLTRQKMGKRALALASDHTNHHAFQHYLDIYTKAKSHAASRNSIQYYEERRHYNYYREVLRILKAEQFRSIIDVGSKRSWVLEHLNKDCLKVSLDIKCVESRDLSIGHIQADFLTWRPDRVYDVVLCLQVLEHVEDPKEFAQKLFSVGKSVLISVPYLWPRGVCKSHIHDPVDDAKIEEWIRRAPDSRLVVKDNGRKRLVLLYREHPSSRV